MPCIRETYRDRCSLAGLLSDDDDALHEWVRRTVIWVASGLFEHVLVHIPLTESFRVERTVVGGYRVRIVVVVGPFDLRAGRDRDGRGFEHVVRDGHGARRHGRGGRRRDRADERQEAYEGFQL